MATGIRSDGTLLTDQGIQWNHQFDFSSVYGDMTGYDVLAKGRRGFGAADPPFFSLTIGSGLTLDGSNRLVTMLIDDATLAGIPPSQQYVWELRIEDGSGNGILAVKTRWEHSPGVIE